MNLLNTLLILGLALCLGTTTMNAQNVTIPDANFKAYLVGNAAINTNGDSQIQVSEASGFTGGIYCANKGIADLTGIEKFVNLRRLNCHSNSLSTLDVDANTKLTYLDCANNQLSSLNVIYNTSLKSLFFDRNNLSIISLATNINLTALDCSSNNLRRLTLINSPNLKFLYCSSNRLVNLDVKNGNYTKILRFYATNNPDLTCIEVDNVSYSATNWTNIDAVASFATSCVFIPMATPSNTNLVANTEIGDREVESTIALATINTINKTINLRAYPNPTTKEITLDFGKSYEEATIQVTNLTGQIVLSKTLTNSARATLELEGAAGIYFVSIHTEEGKATLKVIKE